MRARPIIARVPHDRPIRGIEVGVWLGKLSGRLLQRLPLLHLTMVDRWKAPEPGDSYFESDTLSRRAQSEFDGALEHATEIAKAHGDRAIIIQAKSTDAAELFSDGGQDFVFIDADHTYPGVSADLEAWASKVKPGGLLCGHDYGQTMHTGVKEAVDEWLAEAGPAYELELDEDHTWFVRIP